MSALQFTIYTSTVPQQLTKIFGLASDGTLTKVTAASMSAGTAQRTRVTNLNELAQHLYRLTSAQAVGWGIGASELATIVAQDADTGTDPTRVSCTRRHFVYPKGPGILLLDHDGALEGVLDRDALRLRLIATRSTPKAAPQASGALRGRAMGGKKGRLKFLPRGLRRTSTCSWSRSRRMACCATIRAPMRPDAVTRRSTC